MGMCALCILQVHVLSGDFGVVCVSMILQWRKEKWKAISYISTLRIYIYVYTCIHVYLTVIYSDIHPLA